MYSIRLAALEDAGIIAGHRHRMFLDMGKYDPLKLAAMTSAYRPWLESKIINVYTEAVHRRRGLARLLLIAALDWCRANGVDVVILHASKEGRRLYESAGFAPTNEMRLVLD